MTHTTKYETRNGKTYRAKDTPPVTGEAAKPAAAPETNAAAETTHTPDKTAKKGA
jgi:hypothetical protein